MREVLYVRMIMLSESLRDHYKVKLMLSLGERKIFQLMEMKGFIISSGLMDLEESPASYSLTFSASLYLP